MPQRRCCVASCSSTKLEGVVLHYFPNPMAYPERFKTWVTNAGLNGESEEHVHKKRRICDIHFEDIYRYPNNRLNRLAIPTLHLPGAALEMVEHIHLDSFRPLSTGPSPVNMEEFNVAFTARGLMPPVFTPLNHDHTINLAPIPGYAKFLADAGIKSVLVGGTTGEHMTLGVSDRKKVIAEWVSVGKRTGLHVMVQVGGAPFRDVIELTKFCSQAGVDSLLTLPELYFKPTTVDALVSYVELVAGAAPNLPVLYYHIPSNTKVEINMPAFVGAASARIPNFKGIKFTSNDLSEGAQVLRSLTGDQEMFLGADTLLAPGALLGIKSSIGTSYNLFPKLAQDILCAVASGDVQLARILQEKLSLAIEAHTVEGPWVPVMKAGMEIVTGIKVGPPGLPQDELSSVAKQRIAGKLKALKLID